MIAKYKQFLGLRKIFPRFWHILFRLVRIMTAIYKSYVFAIHQFLEAIFVILNLFTKYQISLLIIWHAES